MLEPWGIALGIFTLLVVALLTVWAHLRYWARRLGLLLSYDHEEVLPTPDGSAIELRRVNAHKPGSELPPVLLVHGICANHRNQDISIDGSLARHLAAQGRDVWLLTLRSGRAKPWREVPRPAAFRTMVEHDVPMGIARVRELTGAPKLDYVGFSMGGMLLYAAIGRSVNAEHLRHAVFVGSPGRVQPPVGVPRFLRFLPAAFVPPILSGTLGTGFAFLSEWLPTPIHRMIYNPKNMGRGITRLALVDCVQDVPGSLLADFMLWATSGGTVRVGTSDILDDLADVTVPALFIAGADDRVGPPSAVRVAFEAWAKNSPGVLKAFLVLGKTSGTQEDYGHGDLAMGVRVGTELYPLIASFLRREPELAKPVLEHGEVRRVGQLPAHVAV
ncbi:MAG: alpha/beta fold hydrolase [Myxococcota bacterium]